MSFSSDSKLTVVGTHDCSHKPLMQHRIFVLLSHLAPRKWIAHLGGPVAYGQKTARRPLAVYRRKRRRSSTGLAPHCALRDGGWLGRNWSQASPKETAGGTGTMCRGRRPTPPASPLSFSVFSQGFGFLPGGGVNPLGEPAIDQYRLHASSVRGVTRARRCRQR